MKIIMAHGEMAKLVRFAQGVIYKELDKLFFFFFDG